MQCENPCTGIKTFKTQARERFIQPGDEFERFANALNNEENETLRDFFWMCLFTGARCSNVLAMEWSQTPAMAYSDHEKQRFANHPSNNERDGHFFAAEKKDSDAHPQWVFPIDRKGWKTGDKGHIVAPRKAFMRIIENAGIKDLRIHDLRRTAGSYMAMQNVSPTIIGKALGHRSPQSTAIYARLTHASRTGCVGKCASSSSRSGKVASE
ncbi:MAG: site-specific integrase [Candidatus Obscuribacterales bacterium]|nr:site-specific integrase [Candidatus Obscuribacterales bacterium]